MKPNLKILAPIGVALSISLLSIGCGGSSSSALQTGTYDAALKFDPSAYTTINVTVDGTAMKVRKYGPIKYVANPIKMATSQSGTTLSDPYAMQEMYVYVPEMSANNQTTAIWMIVGNAGWIWSSVTDWASEGFALVSSAPWDPGPVACALKAGYVVASVGTRGRNAIAADGITYAGKAPACVVDTKAAIRYLKLNDSLMPGSAERIVINGTSGGGGLVTTVGASGNSTDYNSYLADIGAAGISGTGSSATSTIKDNVFAVTAYCPINNLANADAGYEWQYNAIRSDANTAALGGVSYSTGPQPAASLEIASAFPGYVANLGLKLEDGTNTLTAARIPDILLAQLKAEIERQIAAGVAVPDFGGTFTVNSSTYTNDWLTLTGSGTSAKVANINYTAFLKFVASTTALKTVVPFDATGVTGNPAVTGEGSLYGAATSVYSNFSEWSWDHNATVGDGSGLFDTGYTWSQYLGTPAGMSLAKQLKMTSPIPYLSTTSSDVAPYWYVRHGMVDRDTSFAIQILLYYAIKNNANVKDVNFKIPYLRKHSGNYDAATDAFPWIAAKLAAAN